MCISWLQFSIWYLYMPIPHHPIRLWVMGYNKELWDITHFPTKRQVSSQMVWLSIWEIEENYNYFHEQNLAISQIDYKTCWFLLKFWWIFWWKGWEVQIVNILERHSKSLNKYTSDIEGRFTQSNLSELLCEGLKMFTSEKSIVFRSFSCIMQQDL